MRRWWKVRVKVVCVWLIMMDVSTHASIIKCNVAITVTSDDIIVRGECDEWKAQHFAKLAFFPPHLTQFSSHYFNKLLSNTSAAPINNFYSPLFCVNKVQPWNAVNFNCKGGWTRSLFTFHIYCSGLEFELLRSLFRNVRNYSDAVEWGELRGKMSQNWRKCIAKRHKVDQMELFNYFLRILRHFWLNLMIKWIFNEFL